MTSGANRFPEVVFSVEIAEIVQDSATFRLVGELDHAAAATLARAVQALNPIVEWLHLDCSQLSFIGAGGVGAIVAAEQRLGGRNHLVVHDPPKVMVRVLSICGLEHLIAVDPQRPTP